MAIDSPRDAMGRRRFEFGRQPTRRNGKYITIEPTGIDIAIFKAVATHGMLPTNYLTEFIADDGYRNANYLKNRVIQLYNEAGAHGGSYLDIPLDQVNSKYFRKQPVIVKPNKYTEAALLDEDIQFLYRKLPDGGFRHELMGATHTASIDLCTRQDTKTYISQEQILAHPNCPQSTKDSKNPLKIPITKSRSLIIDGLDAIKNERSLTSFYTIENDRKTESIEGYDSLKIKVELYIEMYRRKIHQKHFGIPMFRVRMLTINETHANNILKMIAHVTANEPDKKELRKLFMLQHNHAFKRVWKVPPIMTHLYTDPWVRVDDTVLL